MSDGAHDVTGGAHDVTGGARHATAGARDATGGAPQATGGAPDATGGARDATGGAPDATGGAPQATGGAPDATAGAPQATGGAPDVSRGSPTDPLSLPLTGGCGCGAVRFEVSAPLTGAGYCHCTRCQRRTGTAASANARPAPGSLRVVQGEDRLRSWRPEGGFEKLFCGDCGSALFSRQPGASEMGGIRLGAFDRDPGVRPSWRQYVDYAVPWEPIPDDGLPRYPEGRVAD